MFYSLEDKTPDELSAVGAILDAQKSSTRYISRRKERVRDNNHVRQHTVFV
jgi:hypothetical protein